MENEISASEELRLLNERRTALERAVRIAASIERLHHGLQAAMLMGKPAASIPKKMLNHLDRLDDAIKIMPSAKLKEILVRLEQEVQKRFALIMQLAEMDETQLIDMEAEQGEDIESVLLGYRKKAQTAVTLKILLHGRGEVTKPMPLPVQVEDIRQRLSDLNDREQNCRQVVRKEIVGLVEETGRILKQPNLPKEMQEALLSAQQDFQDNLAHLDAGKTVITMPVTIEIVEMSDRTPLASTQESSTAGSAGEPKAVATDVVESASELGERKTPKGKRPGLLSKLRRWVAAPLDVTWGDVEREVEEKEGRKKPKS